MLRNPAVAGQFYPASASQLRKMIKSFVDEKAEKQDVVGLVSPHAGYIYYGPVAGATISRIKFIYSSFTLSSSFTNSPL